MTDVRLYAHPHTFPNSNVHRHVHPHDDGHADAYSEAHPDPSDIGSFPCVDCEPWRAQAQAIRSAARFAESDAP